MRKGVIACSLTLALLALPAAAWAHVNPDFDEDAKPILRTQPGLLHYVQSRFDVRDTGQAKFPGDDDHRPGPPYIFHARPHGSRGPYTLLLLIQPGPPGHVLGVVDSTRLHAAPPGGPPAPEAPEPPQVTQQPTGSYQSPTLSQGELKPLPPENAPAQNPTPAPPAAPSSPSEPTADTPSGPIIPNSATGSSQPQPSLAPPPDPAPAGE